jgi:hypothetical protein
MRRLALSAVWFPGFGGSLLSPADAAQGQEMLKKLAEVARYFGLRVAKDNRDIALQDSHFPEPHS